MMDEKRLKKEYRKWIRRTSPDLWERIDGNLKPHPERSPMMKAEEPDDGRLAAYMTIPFGRQVAAFTAALILIVVVWQTPGILKSLNAGGQNVHETAFAGSAAETVDVGFQEVRGDRGRADFVSDMPQTGRLHVPAGAVTVPADQQYFSEAVLRDTELLFSGAVLNAKLEYDEDGKAVQVSYELQVRQVHYAEDYISGAGLLTVKSPIIEADSDEAYVLYQMEPGSEYLLPVKKKDGEWELIYPFAPQVQKTADGAWQFHSGYVSLTNDRASVVAGKREGDNDFYYDRLLLREDGGFIQEFVALVQAYTVR